MWWQSVGGSLVLISLAEIGDKSQLVCMALAARHGRTLPVIFGAATAFSLVNAVAAMFGNALTDLLPQAWILGAMATLFAAFGIQSLLYIEATEDEEERQISGSGLFISALLMIFLAEMGDKTQIAVAGLAGTFPATAVWLGATLALTFTSAIGALAGKKVLRWLPMLWLRRLAGLLFVILSVLTVWRLLEVTA